MVRWPTSEFPIWPSGRPTDRPEAFNLVTGYSLNNLSRAGIFALSWAFPSLRRFMPHPSRTIRITGFVDFSLSHKAHRQYRLSFYLYLLFLFQFSPALMIEEGSFPFCGVQASCQRGRRVCRGLFFLVFLKLQKFNMIFHIFFGQNACNQFNPSDALTNRNIFWMRKYYPGMINT